MRTTINKNFHVEQPIDKVWDFLADPHRIVTCVPGASLTEEIDSDNYKGEVTLKFGPVKAKYAGQITFIERNVESRKMHLKGKGLDSKGKGSADMVMHGELTENNGGTDVAYSMEVAVTGMLAQFGSRLIQDVSNSVFNQFVNNFKSKLAGEEVDNTMNAGSMIGTVVKSTIGGIFGGKKD